MKYFDTFTGIGGFTRAIEQVYENKNIWNNSRELQTEGELSAEGENPIPNISESSDNKSESDALVCVGYSEIDKYASSIYQKHYPEHKNYGDITKINAEELPDFDLLVGGFPCQAFSIAGKRGGFEDTRGTLFFDLARILQTKKPRLFVFENVKGLLSHDKGNTFKTIIKAIDELGYDCQWQVLNSKNFGVPQNRERVFIVGNLRGTSRPKVFPIGSISKENTNSGVGLTPINFKHKAGDGMSTRSRKRTELCCTLAAKPGQNGAMLIEQLNNPTHSNDRVYGTDGVSPTLNTMQGGNRQPFVATRNDGMEVEMDIANSVTPDAYLTSGKRGVDEDGKTKLTSMCDRRIRRLTPVECERLQGFPDNWTEGISDTQRYKCCGNAVTVNVVQTIMEKLLEEKGFKI